MSEIKKENVGEMRKRQVAMCHVAIDALHQIAAEHQEAAACIQEDLKMLGRHALDLADDTQARAW